MAVHMIKLCVGADTIEDLVDWRRRGSAPGEPWILRTRMTPKRADEIEDGGSLFWVMKGSVTCRMPILDISTKGEGKAKSCVIKLSPEVIRTAPQARRPFQGWRYLEAKDAPPDLSTMDAGDLPDDLAKQLRELGAW